MDPLEYLAHWGIGLVFAATLAEHAGLPIPAAPVLVAAGALAQDGRMRPEMVIAVAFAACLVADHAWFIAGRLRGRTLLGLICRLSLSPDTCVRKTDDLIARHGAALLLVAKFVPGISAVAIPTSAAMGLAYRRFLLYDAIGCAAWCGAYAGLGMVFGREVRRVLDAMASVGGWSMIVLAALLTAYIGAKMLHRAALRRLFRLVRISPLEAAALLAAGAEEIVFVDARSRLARETDPRRLPNAIVFEEGSRLEMLPGAEGDRTLITFCTCPNEASAALLAERLIKAGYSRVRVLTGGTDALEVLAG